MKRRLFFPLFFVLLLGPMTSTAVVQKTRTFFIDHLQAPIEGVVINPDWELKIKGHISSERLRETSALYLSGAVFWPLGLSWGALSLLETFSIQQHLSILGSLALGSALSGWILQQSYVPTLKEHFGLTEQESGTYYSVTQSSPLLGSHRKLTKRIQSLMLAPAIRIKNKEPHIDYKLKHFSFVATYSERGHLQFEDVRAALVPQDKNVSRQPVTTSVLKLRPKKPVDCFKQLFSVFHSLKR